MQQFQISFTDQTILSKKLDEINQWCDTHPAYTKIVRIYSEDMELDHIKQICDILNEKMPDALYLGCTSNANILDGVLVNAKFILTCTIFEYETTQAKVLQFPFTEETVKEDVENLRNFCADHPWVKAVEMHATIMDMSMKEFCDEMTKLPKEIQVFGGGAFNPNMDDDRAFVFSKGNGFLEHGIVFLLLGGEDFHTYSTFISGWKPLKRRFRVTKADREILYELDGKPAFEIYQKFLNINKNDKFFSNTLEFPLFVEHDDVDILRCPLAVNDDDSLVMSSDMQEDTIVRLAYGDPETILSSIRRDPFRGVAPTTGFYTHGEFLRIHGDMLNFNVTLVIAAMREGEPKTNEIVSIYDIQLDNVEKIPIIRRFVSFIEASTAELEEINMKLAMTSITDGLTKLYNRAEIERRIHSALEKRANNRMGHGLSLIMLDIDNFKKVNDIYGHKEGDHVIQALSDVLREETIGIHSCFIGRWGGEEFMVLLSESNAEEAARLAEKIRLAFAAVTYETAGPQTVSIGVTQMKDGEDADTIYTRVDKALYTAKANGKNQVVRMD